MPAVPAVPAASVVVVSWDGRDELAKALGCLARQTVPLQVVVVDNGSSDGSVEMVRADHPDVDLLVLPANEGFAHPNNLAFARTSAPWVLTLNNDVTVDDDFVERLLAVARDAPDDVYAVGPALVYADRPDTVQTLGIEPLPNGNGANVGKNEPIADHVEVRDIFGCCAGAALYRRSVIEEIGLFDGRYFAYLEDLDLAHRARSAGYRALSAPSIVGRHVHSYTAGRLPFVKLSLIERNRLLNLLKHYPLWALLLEPITTLLVLARFRLTADKAKVSAEQRSYLALRNVPQVLRILVGARVYLVRHGREFRTTPVVP